MNKSNPVEISGRVGLRESVLLSREIIAVSIFEGERESFVFSRRVIMQKTPAVISLGSCKVPRNKVFSLRPSTG